MIRVLRPGILSTIQDFGRHGYREFGVPLSGVMDTYSAEMANGLLNNDTKNAVLEMAMVGPRLQFNTGTQIAITGADMSPRLNEDTIKNNTVYNIANGDVIDFGKLNTGLRSYLAVKGGLKTDLVLGSRSYYRPITKQSAIQKGDCIAITNYEIGTVKAKTFSKLKPIEFSSSLIEVYKGPEFNMLSETQNDKLFSTAFKVSSLYNRMAYQLEPIFENELQPILTGPVLPGTVQLAPSGKLIVLMRDCQTTGGYPRVLQLSEAAINLLSQKKERDTIRFNLI